MATPVPQIALHDALAKEKQRQVQMGSRSGDSEDVLLDEEGIALNDLTHQRSSNIGEPYGTETPGRPAMKTPFQSSSNVAQRGWRRNAGNDNVVRRDTQDVLYMGRLYERMGKMSIIPRYFIYIFPLGLLIAVPIIVGALIPELELGVYHYSYGVDCRASV